MPPGHSCYKEIVTHPGSEVDVIAHIKADLVDHLGNALGDNWWHETEKTSDCVTHVFKGVCINILYWCPLVPPTTL